MGVAHLLKPPRLLLLKGTGVCPASDACALVATPPPAAAYSMQALPVPHLRTRSSACARAMSARCSAPRSSSHCCATPSISRSRDVSVSTCAAATGRWRCTNESRLAGREPRSRPHHHVLCRVALGIVLWPRWCTVHMSPRHLLTHRAVELQDHVLVGLVARRQGQRRRVRPRPAAQATDLRVSPPDLVLQRCGSVYRMHFTSQARMVGRSVRRLALVRLGPCDAYLMLC